MESNSLTNVWYFHFQLRSAIAQLTFTALLHGVSQFLNPALNASAIYPHPKFFSVSAG